MIVNFQINGVTIQASGEDEMMIRSGILAHLMEIQKTCALWKDVVKKLENTAPKKDVEDLDFDNDKNPEDEERKEFDPDYDSIG